MKLDDLAPWIAIAFTLALSILVPLFTQIANNRHQRKMQRENQRYQEKQKRIQSFEMFLAEVGGLITAGGHNNKEQLIKAGAALHQLYMYAPSEWFEDLDMLMKLIMDLSWDKARPIIQKLSKQISEELKKR